MAELALAPAPAAAPAPRAPGVEARVEVLIPQSFPQEPLLGDEQVNQQPAATEPSAQPPTPAGAVPEKVLPAPPPAMAVAAANQTEVVSSAVAPAAPIAAVVPAPAVVVGPHPPTLASSPPVGMAADWKSMYERAVRERDQARAEVLQLRQRIAVLEGGRGVAPGPQSFASAAGNDDEDDDDDDDDDEDAESDSGAGDRQAGATAPELDEFGLPRSKSWSDDSTTRIRLGYELPEGAEDLPELATYDTPAYQQAVAVLQRLARRVVFRRRLRTARKMRNDDSEGKQLRKRNQLLKEILATEQTYVDNLVRIVGEFQRPMYNPPPDVDPLPEEALGVIFGGIDTILSVHTAFLRDLEDCMRGFPFAVRIGDVFLALAPKLNVYTEFVNNFELARNHIEVLRASRPDLAEFLSTKTFWHTQLSNLLITPVQRVPRYVLLLRELIGCTPNNGTEFFKLKGCFVAFKSMTTLINETKRMAEMKARVLEVSEKLHGRVKLYPTLRAGPLSVYVSGLTLGLTRGFKARFCVLEGDELHIHAVQAGGSGAGPLERTLNVSNCGIATPKMNEAAGIHVHHRIVLALPDTPQRRGFDQQLAADSEQERDDWVQALRLASKMKNMGFYEQLNAPHRRMVLEGEGEISVQMGGSANQLRHGHWFMFNDLLLITKPREERGGGWEFVSCLLFQQVRFVKRVVLRQKNRQQTSVMVTDGTTEYMLGMDSAKVDLFVTQIRKLVNTCTELMNKGLSRQAVGQHVQGINQKMDALEQEQARLHHELADLTSMLSQDEDQREVSRNGSPSGVSRVGPSSVSQGGSSEPSSPTGAAHEISVTGGGAAGGSVRDCIEQKLQRLSQLHDELTELEQEKGEWLQYMHALSFSQKHALDEEAGAGAGGPREDHYASPSSLSRRRLAAGATPQQLPHTRSMSNLSGSGDAPGEGGVEHSRRGSIRHSLNSVGGGAADSADDSFDPLGGGSGGGDSFPGTPAASGSLRRLPLVPRSAVIVPPAEASIIYEGFMSKRGNRRSRSYQERWFVLRGSSLFYFKRISDRQFAGEIDLRNGASVTLNPANPNEFTVTPSGVRPSRTYHLACADPESRAAWVSHLQAVIDAINDLSVAPAGQATPASAGRRGSSFFSFSGNRRRQPSSAASPGGTLGAVAELGSASGSPSDDGSDLGDHPMSSGQLSPDSFLTPHKSTGGRHQRYSTLPSQLSPAGGGIPLAQPPRRQPSPSMAGASGHTRVLSTTAQQPLPALARPPPAAMAAAPGLAEVPSGAPPAARRASLAAAPLAAVPGIPANQPRPPPGPAPPLTPAPPSALAPALAKEHVAPQPRPPSQPPTAEEQTHPQQAAARAVRPRPPSGDPVPPAALAPQPPAPAAPTVDLPPAPAVPTPAPAVAIADFPPAPAAPTAGAEAPPPPEDVDHVPQPPAPAAPTVDLPPAPAAPMPAPAVAVADLPPAPAAGVEVPPPPADADYVPPPPAEEDRDSLPPASHTPLATSPLPTSSDDD